jgi:hypothetical protein
MINCILSLFIKEFNPYRKRLGRRIMTTKKYGLRLGGINGILSLFIKEFNPYRKRLGRRIMTTKKYGLRLGGIAMISLTIASGALAVDSNSWQAVTGNYNGNFTDAAHWTLGTTPTIDHWVFFSNLQSSAYTVQLTASVTSGPLRVYDDSVTYDLKGYRWTVDIDGGGSTIGTNPNYAMTVKFSSSSPTNVVTGNTVDFGTHAWHYDYIGASTLNGRKTRVVVDDSLGYPAKVIFPVAFGRVLPDSDMLVSGTGSELSIGYLNGGSLDGNILATSGATFKVLYVYGAGAIGSYWANATVTVANASMYTPAMTLGGYLSGRGTVVLRDGGAWSAGGDVYLGVDGISGGTPHFGILRVTNGAFAGQSVIVGGNNGNGPAPGLLSVHYGGLATVSNSLWISRTNSAGRATYTAALTNTLVLDNGAILLGGALNGSLTNEGIMQAAGQIVGKGPANFPLANNGMLKVGNSLGTLSLTNCTFVNESGGTIFFEFGATTSDRINISGGTAVIGGALLFAPLDLIPKPSLGAAWDFIRADDITYTATDNMAALMTSYGLTGSDYTFGVVPYGSGEALRLKIYGPPGVVIEVQ